MTLAERQLLTDLRRTLLHLHKTLLDWERIAYERVHGRVAGHELLSALLNEPQFAWLRPVSELVVRIDATLDRAPSFEPDPPESQPEVAAVVARARALVAPDEAGDDYARRYHAALQERPDVVLAHRELVAVLKGAPPERIH